MKDILHIIPAITISLGLWSCTSTTNTSGSFPYDNLAFVANYALQIATNEKIDGRTIEPDELVLQTIHYFTFRLDYVSVTFIDRSSLSFKSDGSITFSAVSVDITPTGMSRIKISKPSVHLGESRLKAFQEQPEPLAKFKEPSFYNSIAQDKILKDRASESIRTKSDLEVDRVAFNYFDRPQQVELNYTIKPTVKNTGLNQQSSKWVSAILDVFGNPLGIKP